MITQARCLANHLVFMLIVVVRSPWLSFMLSPVDRPTFHPAPSTPSLPCAVVQLYSQAYVLMLAPYMHSNYSKLVDTHDARIVHKVEGPL